MRSGSSWIPLAVVGVIACTRAQESRRAGPEPSEVRARPSANAAATPDAEAPGSVSSPRPDDGGAAPKAWTDRAAIARLAQDCSWTPEKDAEGSGALSCDLEFEQSCVPDPCFDSDQSDCKPACKKGCDVCTAGCTTSCEACKAPCTSSACKEACATQCGACHQACLTTKDRCTSGTCGKKFAACRAALSVEWKKADCEAACTKVAPCARECSDRSSDDPKCTERCRKRFMGKCPDKFFWMCVMGADPAH